MLFSGFSWHPSLVSASKSFCHARETIVVILNSNREEVGLIYYRCAYDPRHFYSEEVGIVLRRDIGHFRSVSLKDLASLHHVGIVTSCEMS